jgi:hypothetical protein
MQAVDIPERGSIVSDTPRRDGPARNDRSSGGRGGAGGSGRGDWAGDRGDRSQGDRGQKQPWAKRSESGSGSRPAEKQPTEKRLWTKGGAPARGDRDAREREVPEDRDPFGIRSVRAYHEAPEIPEDVTPKQLDRVALNELKTLSKENAEGVAKHLVMAARLIEDDPQLAHSHAISAARRAGRIGVVRETLAITAYAIEDYALALRELRTYRRITGRDDQLPMMVDSERGLDRPEKALELGRSVPRSSLPVPVQVELAIAMSGARLDLGDAAAALVELEIPQLDPETAFSYSPGLFDAYATVLEELGRGVEAEQWFARAERAEEALDEQDGDEDMIEVVEEDVVGSQASAGQSAVETGARVDKEDVRHDATTTPTVQAEEDDHVDD